jgi:transposase
MTTTCARCGTVTEEAASTWTVQTGPRGTEWLCERCTRENLRAIEGRLDAEWW